MVNKIIIGLIIIGLGIAVYLGVSKKEPNPVGENPQLSEKICFYSETHASGDLYDIAWATMQIDGESVTGELRNLPAEKDSKVGTFTGTIQSEEDSKESQTIDAWWDSFAEGMRVTEELKIMLSDDNAKIGFSEMVDRGDGTYVYKDSNDIPYWQSIDRVSCENLDERLLVEKYIRDNIIELAPEEPVLGGSWYVTSLHLDEKTKTGKMSYEDGHIMGGATFSYSYDTEVTIYDIKKID